MSTIWKPHVVVATVLEENNKYLLVEESVDAKRVLNQPAGHLEPGESLKDAAIRETLEETGRVVSIDYLIGIYLMCSEDFHNTFLRFCFKGKILSYDENRKLDDDIIRTHWMSKKNLTQQQKKPRSSLVMKAIQDYEKGNKYSLTLLHTEHYYV
jgi:8-oxo-dGTP pyrophosphatase MutT (NUDIX family)